jgi:hypothetical protein
MRFWLHARCLLLGFYVVFMPCCGVLLFAADFADCCTDVLEASWLGSVVGSPAVLVCPGGVLVACQWLKVSGLMLTHC